jgi:hypothetical protein
VAQSRRDGQRSLRAQRGGNPTGWGDDSSNAIANFEFDVALAYRRGEKLFKKPRRRSTT